MKIFVFHLLILIALVGCMPGKSNLQISMAKKGSTVSSSVTTASVSSVQVINNQLVINGNGFIDVTTIKVNGNSLNENFTIESKTATKIIANSIRAFSFDISKVFSLILSDANASATFAIDFSLCNATLNGKGFNCAAPVADKDVLAYDAISGTWKPRPASGLNYLGTFDASTNPGSGPAIQPAGAYYVISDDGTIAAVSFAVGDWLVSNGSTWQKIDNSSAVLSVFGRNGAITAQHGDYTLDLLGDVSFPVAPVAGKVLKFDGTNWVAGDDLSGGGAGSVTTTALANGAVTDAKIDTVSASKITGTITSAQIADGSIVNADINAAAAIDYSKLNIADGAIPVAKITGIPAVTTVLTATIANGDTTHAPTSDAVYDALALKLGTNGGVLTTGTISGLPTPVGPTEAANKSYVDTAIAGVNAFTEAAVLATDLAGLNTGVNGPITASDTVLGAFGKMQYQVTDLKAKGLWDKSVNDIAYTAGNVSIDKKLRLKSDNTNYVEILSPIALAATYTLTLPPNDGNADQVLKTNGTGTLSWADITDTGVQAFAKTALPTCGAGEVLKSNGTAFSCVTDASVPAFTGTANRAVATTGAGGSLAVQAVTSTELGYLSGVTSAIQTQLNGKEGTLAAGTSAQYYRGDKTWATLNTAGVPELTNLYFTEARAIASPLTGVSSTAGTITAADTILGAFGKLLNTQTDYVSKTANSTITGTLTINSIVGALKVPSPVNVDDAVPKSYVDGFGQWTKSGSDLYRAGGVIGLGTTTPDRRLTIIGDGTNYGDDIYMEAVNSETATPQISLARSRGTTAARTPVLANDNLGTLAFRGNDINGSGGTFPSASRIFSQAETDFATAINGNLVFQTNSAGTLAEKMRITSKGMVGVGNATPTAKVSVGQTSASSGAVTLTAAMDASTFTTSAAITLNAGDYLIPTTTTGQARGVLIGGNGTSFTVTPPFSAAVSGETFTIYHGGINIYDKVFVQGSTGYFGIGTKTPERALHIVGTGGVDDDVIIASNTTGSTAGSLIFTRSRGTYGSEAAILSGDNILDITARGHNGLVYGIVSGIASHAESDFATSPSGDIRLSTKASGVARTEKMRITGAGYVGINNTNPAAPLDIVGDAIISGGSSSLQLKAGAADDHTYMSFFARTATPALRTAYIGTPNAGSTNFNIANEIATGSTLFYTNGAERMRVDPNGRVGIGTSAPTADLHLAGNLDGDVSSYMINGDDTGATSRSLFLIGTSTSGLRYGYLAHHGAGFVTSGPYKARTTVLSGNDTGGLNFNGNSQIGLWVSSGEKMKILANGNVGIGVTTPDDKLVVYNGTTTGRYTATGWTHSSDARLKHDIHTITSATEKILKLRGVDYLLNNDPTNERQLGFIAQEVEPLFPEVVKTDKDGYKSMVYANLLAPLVEAFKDLYKKVTDIFMTTEKNTRAIASVNLKVKKLEEENAAKTKEIAELKAYLCAKDPRAPICK